jgi:hypothetical protein
LVMGSFLRRPLGLPDCPGLNWNWTMFSLAIT